MIFATKGKQLRKCRDFSPARHQKHHIYRVFFVPKTFKNWLTPPNWRLLGPVRITAIINNSSDSKRLSLDCFLFHFFLRCWCGDAFLHRYASANRRRYAQKPLHRAAFIRRYSYTERFVHRETFAHRRLYTEGLHAKKLLRTGVFAHLCFTRRCFCTAQHLRTDGFTLHTGAFTHSRFHTQKLLNRETFAQNTFYAKNSPPTKKRQTGIWGWIFLASCPW